MSDEDLVTCQIDGVVARLHLNRPTRGNALNGELAAAFRQAATSLSRDVRVIRLSSEGPMFCVGGDLAYVHEHTGGPGQALRELAADLHAALTALIAHDAPVVARVQGAAGGAGMSLVCACDISIAAHSATLTSAYTRGGLSPDGGLTWLLPRIVGPPRAKDIMLTNRRLSASEALALGIITRVVDDDKLDETVDAIVQTLAAGAPQAQAAVKRLVATSASTPLDQHLTAEAESISALAETTDGREGVTAFLEKPAPNFA